MKVFAIASLALGLLAGTAHAQPRDVGKADALFREGRALMNNGDFQKACNKLEQSYRLDPAAGTAVNLGDCFDKIGKVGSALLAYQAARALLDADDARLKPVAEQISKLARRTPKLVVTLGAKAPDKTVVRRGGRDVELGVSIPLNPGTHALIVSAPQRAPRRYLVLLGEADSREVVVEPGGATDTDPAQGRQQVSPDEAVESSSLRTWGYVVGGAGLGTVAFGTYNLFDHRIREIELDDSCKPGAPGPDCTDDNRDASNAAGKRAAWGLGVGLGLVGVGAYLLLRDAKTRGTPAKKVVAVPVLARDVAGISMAGTW